jgi:hypothetical protein
MRVLRHVRLELLAVSCVLGSSGTSVKEPSMGRCCVTCVHRGRVISMAAWPDRIVSFSSLRVKQLIESFYPSYTLRTQYTGARSKANCLETVVLWNVSKKTLEPVSSWKMVSSGMLRRLVLVRTDVSEELIASIIRVTRISDVRKSYQYLITEACSEKILVTLMIEAIRSSDAPALLRNTRRNISEDGILTVLSVQAKRRRLDYPAKFFNFLLDRSLWREWLRFASPQGWSSSPGKVKNFHFFISSRPALGSTNPPIQCGTEASFSRG